MLRISLLEVSTYRRSTIVSSGSTVHKKLTAKYMCRL